MIKQSKKPIRNVISAATARNQLGQILKRAVETDERFWVERRGEPAVIIMSANDYMKHFAPTPVSFEATRLEAKRNGTSTLSMREIDREIAAVRRARGRAKSKQPAA